MRFMSMNLIFKRIGISVTAVCVLAFLASSASAQTVIANSISGMDTAAAPGTEGPADPAPGGKISSDWMSHENVALMTQHSGFYLPTQNQIQAEHQARLEESRLVQRLVLARIEGHDVDPAARNEWLGDLSLSRGDRAMAENYFHRAEEDLQSAKSTTRHVDALALGEDADAVNLHPNTDTATSF
jgi:hypothetical protein